MDKRKLKVVFIHPDLGIGGAERLVVDAGLALQRQGHSVEYWTAHHDPHHCFPETLGELRVTSCGDWLPTSIRGRMRALCACIRMIFISLWLMFVSNIKADVYFVDQVSVCVPILRWLSIVKHGRAAAARVLFYCHFPDQLLCSGREKSLLKRLYRLPLDWLEERTTGLAHRILVNSSFTADVFHRTFPSLSRRRPAVLYPTLDLTAFDNTPPLTEQQLRELIGCGEEQPMPRLLLSLNRFERKKNIGLAVNTFRALQGYDYGSWGPRPRLQSGSDSEFSPGEFADCWLILAGGYDPQNVENRECYEALQRHCRKAGVSSRVTFLRSPDDTVKRQLLSHCTAVLYTPEAEHFGIVPLEAMYCRRPVVASEIGGPRETVVHDVTGFLCTPNMWSFRTAVAQLLRDPARADRMGRCGRDRVIEKFSFDSFSANLAQVLYEMCSDSKND